MPLNIQIARSRSASNGMRELIEKIIKKFIPDGFPAEISVPTHSEFGHYSTNVAMRLAPIEKKSPLSIAEDLKGKILNSAPKGLFLKIETAAPGFLNFWLSDEFLRKELLAIYKNKKKFGRSNLGKGQRIIVEHSSNNIAKPMHVGHLRNTILGDSLANVFDALGYKVIRWNYLGDWGTQFGKLIVAYKLWGNKKEIEKESFGKVYAINLSMNWYRSQEYYNGSGGWRKKWKEAGGGVLMMQAIHWIDVILWLGGEVEKMYGIIDTVSHEMEVEDTAVGIIEFKNRILVTIQASTSACFRQPDRLEIHGTKGSCVIENTRIIQWNFGPNTLKNRLLSKAISFLYSLYPMRKGKIKNQLSDIISNKFKSNGKDSLKSIDVILKLYQSGINKV